MIHDLQGATILIVDDNPANLGVLARSLEAHGFRVLVAQKAEFGFKTAQRVQPDLILLDVLLPDLDGFETCRQLKANEATQDIPVIFMTALTEAEDKIKGFHVGAVDYITKPFQAEEVLVRVTTHLRLRKLTHGLQEQNVHLQLAQEALRQANETLELRVEERTAELLQANTILQQQIAERQQAETALRASEERYRALYRDNPSMFFTLDAEGQVISVNQFGASNLGYTIDELEGQSVLKVFYQADQPAVVEQLKVCLQHPWQMYRWQFRKVHKNGTLLWVEEFARAVRGPDDVLNVLVVCHDITERQRVEAERETLITELETKNAELERFTYTISHDLKSPLITIQGFLGYLEQAALTGNVNQVKADIARISNAVSKMKQLLDELLELSRIGRLMNPLEAVPLADLAPEAVAMVAGRLAERGVEVTIAPDLPVIYGDRPKLRQVLENLVDNAVKYMGNQPHPHVEIGARYANKNGAPIFYVRDNGIGIDARYHQRIFGLFDKLNQNTEGVGVGLTIVKRIIEVHGGQIWVESAGAGQGSTFCFTLPNSKPLVNQGGMRQ